jgi:cytochrome bd-type quinol oxidase subunit 2
MWSPDVDAQEGARDKAEGLRELLDPAFGLFAWAVHFLVVYVATAVACVLGLGAAGTDARSALQATLVVLTAAALAATLLHVLRRYRQQSGDPGLQFRMSLTTGCDAIAMVAIGWQLFPIVLVPACV